MANPDERNAVDQGIRAELLDLLAAQADAKAATALLARAWDRGYLRADNGGSEDENPYQ